MNTTTVTPLRVPIDDTKTRRHAAAAVAKAYIGHPLWWLGLILFTGLTGLMLHSAWLSYDGQLGPDWTAVPLACALICLVFGAAFVPLANASTIYRARDLYYLDTGKARAAMATKPDNRRRQLPDDVQAHTFGAWPRHRGAGSVLGDWVRDQVHAQGGRLTATALPGTARAYKQRGMVDDGHTAFVLPRVASKPRDRHEL